MSESCNNVIEDSVAETLLLISSTSSSRSFKSPIKPVVDVPTLFSREVILEESLVSNSDTSLLIALSAAVYSEVILSWAEAISVVTLSLSFSISTLNPLIWAWSFLTTSGSISPPGESGSTGKSPELIISSR